MTFNRVAIGALLLVTSAGAVAGDKPLEPRTAVRRIPTALLAVPDAATGEMTVKFADRVRARVMLDGEIVSTSGVDIEAAVEVIRNFGLTVRPAFTQSPERLAAIEARAAAASGRQQPDLAGMVSLGGSPAAMLAAGLG